MALAAGLVSGSVSQVAVNLHRDDHQVEEARKSFELGAASPSAPPVYRCEKHALHAQSTLQIKR